jgi:hypothetical protein
MNKSDLLTAMQANSIPAGWSNLWYVAKTTFTKPAPGIRHGKSVTVSPGTYTFLRRLTETTLYHAPAGEIVMEDTPFELQTHLGFVMHARGKVLVTGLGLGCVTRGLLANPHVEHVTCIENSKDVLKLVAPHMPTERLTIVEADALEWTAKNKETFDAGWHDLWTDTDEGEPHLDIWHSTLLANCRDTVRQQGAWAFDRRAKKVLLRHGFRWIG